MTTAVWNTALMAPYVPSENLRAALAKVKATKAAYDQALEDLHDAIAAEVAIPVRPADVGRFVEYHPGSVRRIARDRGVDPYVNRTPPQLRDTDEA